MLQNVAMFQALTDEERTFLEKDAARRDFSPGQVIFIEGSPSDSFSVVERGEIEIIKSLGGEAERVIKRLGPGDIVGEMSLLHQEHRRTASARASAAAPVRLLDIPLGRFEMLVRRKPELAYALVEVVTKRLSDTENAVIRDLKEKNLQLAESLRELQEAQAQLIAAEKLENELSVARRIQESMLPETLPSLPGWALAAHWQPAHAVSGDFYDFVPLPDGRLAIVVGDVTGKGVPAALLMTVTRSILRTAAPESATPGELLTRVNNLLCPDMPESMFVTCHVSYLDPASGRVEYANAGHCLPLLSSRRLPSGPALQDEKAIRELRAAGMPLGLFPGMTYTGGVEQIQPDSRLLYFSDGLIEAQNAQGEMFRVQSLKKLLADCSAADEHPTGRAVIEFCLRSLVEFQGPGQEQEDDITLVYLEYLPKIE